MTLSDIQALWATAIKDAKLSIPADHASYQTLSAVIHNASWCPDCEREVVELLALNEQAERGFNHIELHSYEDKAHYQALKQQNTLSISCLPTLIFYRDDIEVLRVEEDSSGTLASQLRRL